MGSLADELLDRHDEMVDRWYEAWRRSAHPHHDIAEAGLKDALPAQLRLIGEQLRDLREAENPDEMWKVTERLDPEQRVGQDVPIEEVVQEYGLAVEVIRDWIEERQIHVPFDEYSYFHRAIFELVAESVRRYATHQAKQVTELRSGYLAAVMHQLRTPLSSLSVQVDLLERRPPDARAIATLRRNVRRLRFLVDGVLRLERFRPSDVPLRPEELAPGRLVDELMADVEVEAARKGLRFEAHVDRSLRLTSDPELLADALGNLVQNAVKYTRAGFVILAAEEGPDGTIVFRVRDSGPGIPRERQTTLFRERQPGEAGGAGIGLQIARHAAEALGGEVGLASEPGKGSEFWLRVPRVVKSREPAHDEAE